MKCDIGYFDNLPHMKYPKICELMSRHGVPVGTYYVNKNAGMEFIHYLPVESRR